MYRLCFLISEYIVLLCRHFYLYMARDYRILWLWWRGCLWLVILLSLLGYKAGDPPVAVRYVYSWKSMNRKYLF